MKCVNEKYSLQEYEGKIRDAVLDEIKELNKIAPIVCLFLHKYSYFITTRVISDRDLNCSITLIYYDRDSVKSTSDHAVSNFIGPDVADGITARDNVYTYIPVSFTDAPFSNKRLNTLFDEVCDDYTDDLKRMDGWLHVNNYESLNKEANKLKQKYGYIVDDILDEITDSHTSIKKTMCIDSVFALKTLFHELTHVIDQRNASKVNHFTGIGLNDVDKYGLESALNILYMLWSKTEFNAFTQTFGRDIDKQRDVIKSNYINKVSMKYLSRTCSDGGVITFYEFVNEIYESLDELSNSYYDDDFWEVIKNIAAKGSNESSTAERFNKMTPLRFRNYFIRTSVKLIEKLKEHVVKNIASQNSYDRDISNIATEIKDACSQYDTDDFFDVSFSFNCYFKKPQVSRKVYINLETPDVGLDDYSISNNSIIHITVTELNLGWDLTPRQLFGKDTNSYSELYKEIVTKRRKTKLDRLYINLAEDLNSALNKLVNK